MSKATYQYLEEAHGEGMFFYTDCCNNRMYSIDNDIMRYHWCLCPKCFWEGKTTVLYLRGTKEADEVMRERDRREEAMAK